MAPLLVVIDGVDLLLVIVFFALLVAVEHQVRLSRHNYRRRMRRLRNRGLA